MKHPEILLIPLLLLVDHYLTLTASALDEKRYGKHFIHETNELNPLWQKSVADKKWFNPLHLLGVAAFTLYLVWIDVNATFSEYKIQLVMGFLFIIMGIAVGRSISSILTSLYVIRKPDEINGAVHMKHSFTLAESLHNLIALLILFVMVFSFVQAPFVLGGVLAIIILILMHPVWWLLHKRKAAKQLDK